MHVSFAICIIQLILSIVISVGGYKYIVKQSRSGCTLQRLSSRPCGCPVAPKILKGYCAVSQYLDNNDKYYHVDFAISKSSNMFYLDLAQFSLRFTFFL